MSWRRVTFGPVPAEVATGGGTDRWLLLHGFTGAPTSWVEVVRRLRDVAVALVPWLPGHGGGEWPPELDTFDGAVDALAISLREVHSGAWKVAGYSLGGRVALRLALRHPDLVRELTVIGTRPGLRSEAERAGRRHEDTVLAALLRERGIAAFVAAWEALPLFATQCWLPAPQREAQRAMRLGHAAEGLARTLEVLGVGAMPDCWPLLGTLRMPVRIVVGELDSGYRHIAAEMAAEIGHAVTRVVPGCGHNVVLEDPQTLARLLGPASVGEEGA